MCLAIWFITHTPRFSELFWRQMGACQTKARIVARQSPPTKASIVARHVATDITYHNFSGIY